MSKQLADKRRELIANWESSRAAAREACKVADGHRETVCAFDREHLAIIREFEKGTADAQTA